MNTTKKTMGTMSEAIESCTTVFNIRNHSRTSGFDDRQQLINLVESKTNAINSSLTLDLSINVTSKTLTMFLQMSETHLGMINQVLIILGALTTLGNMGVLLVSKYTTGGRSATLVFIRSLCVADTLIGFFGVLKSLLLRNLNDLYVNCLLPESLFITASTALIWSILWLNIDSCLRLSNPLGYAQVMDKRNVITTMTILWNMSFIIGFVPQMGWNQTDSTCNFFSYYSNSYLLFVSVIWILSFIVCIVTQGVLLAITKGSQLHQSFVSTSSYEFRKYYQIMITMRVDIIIWFVTYMPLLLYISIYCSICAESQNEYKNLNILFFFPLFLIRSFLTAFIHSYRTVQIQQVLKKASQKMSRILRNKASQKQMNDSSESLDSNEILEENGTQRSQTVKTVKIWNISDGQHSTRISSTTLISNISDIQTEKGSTKL